MLIQFDDKDLRGVRLMVGLDPAGVAEEVQLVGVIPGEPPKIINLQARRLSGSSDKLSQHIADVTEDDRDAAILLARTMIAASNER